MVFFAASILSTIRASEVVYFVLADHLFYCYSNSNSHFLRDSTPEGHLLYSKQFASMLASFGFIRFYVVLLVVFFLIDDASSISNPVDFVNLLAGTFTDGNVFSTGNTLPLVGLPWGFNHWSPQTRDNGRHTGSWWFGGNSHVMTWIRCTHQPSPWIGDWGWFLIGPQIGGGEANRNPRFYWEPRAAVLKPHVFDTFVAPDNIHIQLTPSMHGAVLKVTFPAQMVTKRICLSHAEWTAHGMTSPGGGSRSYDKPSGKPWITGRNLDVHIERLMVSNFAMHIRAESDTATNVEAHGDMSCFNYNQGVEEATVLVATSLISPTQATINLNRELRYAKVNVADDYGHNKDDTPRSDSIYDIVYANAKNTWNNLLGRVDVVDPGDLTGTNVKHLSVFYSNLARGLAFPRRIDEVDINGKMVHYSPYDPRGGTHDGPLCTDNGFWDTFRTVYPMLGLLYPEHLSQIVQGWLNAFKEGGWLPTWASPGYRNCMVGTYADVVIADAIVKGVQGFDLNTAKDALIKDSFTAPPAMAGNAVGKSGLDEYNSRGYLSWKRGQGGYEGVSRTLDFGFADFSTSRALNYLAHKWSDHGDLSAKATRLAARAEGAYNNLFDRSHGLMLPKDANKNPSNSWRANEWGNGYTEGNAWHHSFPAYAVNSQDGGGLSQLYGGKQRLISKIVEMLTTPSSFSPGSYGQEIHEMVEARAVAMGQYAHNNQPVHHILWLLIQLGHRVYGETQIRRILDRAYGTDFFAGDEDNGEQGSWYVLSALGLFVTTPGTDNYVLGSPLFRHVRIDRGPMRMATMDVTGNGATGYAQPPIAAQGNRHPYLDIIAPATNENHYHVSEVQLNDQPLHNTLEITHGALMRDGVLRFVMQDEKMKNGGKVMSYDRNQHNNGNAHSNSNNGNSNGQIDTSSIEEVKKAIERLKSEEKISSVLKEELLRKETEIKTLKQLDKHLVSSLNTVLKQNNNVEQAKTILAGLQAAGVDVKMDLDSKNDQTASVHVQVKSPDAGSSSPFLSYLGVDSSMYSMYLVLFVMSLFTVFVVYSLYTRLFRPGAINKGKNTATASTSSAENVVGLEAAATSPFSKMKV